MPSWILHLALLVAGFVLLARGAGGLVDGGATLARRLGVGPLTIGLTVVAWGTSMPEVVVSGYAAFTGHPASSLGNVLGSNVANIGLVLGAGALILPAVIHGKMHLQERIWVVGSLVLLWGVCRDDALLGWEALVLLGAFGVYNLLLLRGATEPDAVLEEQEEHASRRPWLAVVLGSLAIAVGAELAMRGALGLAAEAGLEDRVVGLTILALGTSLPELAAGVTSAVKGHAEIGFGNVVGSNVFNTLAVMGIAGIVGPFDTPEAGVEIARALTIDFPVTAGFTLVLVSFPMLFRKRKGRSAGVFLLVAYLAYMTLVLLG